MKLIIDENLAYGEEAFSKIGNITKSHGRKITNDLLMDSDALIVRSITKVNEDLLRNTKVKFVGTATIGTDHLDKNYLDEKNIHYTSAAGCNAWAVTEYVFSALFHLAKEINFNLTDKSIGIIGHGNIGSKIVKFAEALGMKTIINDPPLQRKTGNSIYKSLDEALTADIITLHVPLNKTGIDKTVHLIDEKRLNSLKERTILINSCRGPVVDNIAMVNRLKENNNIYTVFDVWEEEPSLSLELLNLVNIATPHIAGYSWEGKVNGTWIVHDKLCEFLNIKPEWKPNMPEVDDNVIHFSGKNSIEENFYNLFNKVYPIFEDNGRLKKALELSSNKVGNYFDSLRKDYPFRRELLNYKIELDEKLSRLIKVLETFRLIVNLKN
ncbi:MAG: 4-phosphoerythronate dehydrogenase [Melioribacteraceae bacterium]|nr:4-phosphoerythronate dehydrogenase [Melioribacteraceae bacterium]